MTIRTSDRRRAARPHRALEAAVAVAAFLLAARPLQANWDFCRPLFDPMKSPGSNLVVIDNVESETGTAHEGMTFSDELNWILQKDHDAFQMFGAPIIVVVGCKRLPSADDFYQDRIRYLYLDAHVLLEIFSPGSFRYHVIVPYLHLNPKGGLAMRQAEPLTPSNPKANQYGKAISSYLLLAAGLRSLKTAEAEQMLLAAHDPSVSAVELNRHRSDGRRALCKALEGLDHNDDADRNIREGLAKIVSELPPDLRSKVDLPLRSLSAVCSK
jgi:hypothetical protein